MLIISEVRQTLSEIVKSSSKDDLIQFTKNAISYYASKYSGMDGEVFKAIDNAWDKIEENQKEDKHQ